MRALFRSLATLLLVSALVTATGWSAAWAQEGEATGDVEITEDAEAAPETEPEAKPARPNKMPKPALTDRDPFRNPILSGEVDGGTISRGKDKRAKILARKKAAGEDGEEVTDEDGEIVYEDEIEEDIEPPAVTVTGIVSSSSGRRAILVSPDASYIVGIGDKLSVFKVSAISASAVTFTYKDRNFEVQMEDEFGLRG